MIHTYKLEGMHCSSCVVRIQEALERVEGVKKVIVSLNPSEAVVNMTGLIDTDRLNKAVQSAGAYALSDEVEVIDTMHAGPQATMQLNTQKIASPAQLIDLPNATIAVGQPNLTDSELSGASGFLTTYKPLLLILGYLLGMTALVEFQADSVDWMRVMRVFMAGFFLVFSFFKLLNVSEFASSYRMYDVVAKRIPAYGTIYPFIELALGIAYLTNWNPVLTNVATLIVMSVSAIGIVQSLVNKKKIRCACLGAVFNLPMSTVTLIEDGLMVGMAALMLIKLG